MKRPTKKQLREHEAQDRRAIATADLAYIPGKVPPEPTPEYVPHVIEIPIYRPLVQGEKVEAGDLVPRLDYLELVPQCKVGHRVSGDHLFLRIVKRVPLTVYVHA